MIEPRLILDSAEKWRPVPVEDSLARVGYTWDAGAWVRGGTPRDRLDFPADMTPETFETVPIAGYRRVVPGGGLHQVCELKAACDAFLAKPASDEEGER